MKVILGADHRGFTLKEQLQQWLQQQGYEVIDVGAETVQPDDDYPLVSFALSERIVAEGPSARGILCCGSGIGASIAANKVPGVRCGLGITSEQVKAGRHDDDMNILAVAADFTSWESAQPLVKAFLETAFGSEPRYQRRLDQIRDREMMK
jgi:ribose 5-phosphate isomerase B